MQPMKCRLFFSAAFAVSTLFVAQSAAAFEFGGYFRSGAGANAEGGRQVCYRLAGASADFRLGNECETYAELAFSDTVYEKGDTAADVHARIAYIDYSAQQFSGGDDAQFGIPEFWAEIDNPFGYGMSFWAGKRFYREGIHINDFFFWNNSGTGGGVQGIDLGFGTLEYAVIFNSNLRLEEEIVEPVDDDNDNSMTKQVLRIKEIPVNPGGNLQFAFQYAMAGSEEPGVGEEDGIALLAMHTQTGFLGEGTINRFAVQYGQGAGAGLDAISNPSVDSDVSTIRVLDALVANITRDFSVSLVGVYQQTENADESVSLPETWKSVGTRLIYYVVDHFRLNLEASTSWTEGGVLDTDEEARLSKITFAPALVVGRGFFARPELRLFVTYADWNETAADVGVFQGTATNPFDGTDGLTYGIQAEVWW